MEVHSTAIIDEGATIGARTKIWHWAHVCRDARIGADCVLGQNVYVGPGVPIGDGVKIQNNVSVYEGVVLEDAVFVGPSAVFTNVRNPRSDVSRRDEFQSTIVRRGATIGANATIVCGSELGEHCFIGAGTVVLRDVPAYALMVGAPARQIGWICECGVRLPDSHEPECSDCGNRYRLRGLELVAVSETPESE